MKVAIIGKNSYIGDAVARSLMDAGHTVEVVEALHDAWRRFDFRGCDAVVHVAALVHRKDLTDPKAYESANTVLPLDVAAAAQASGVGQFVFLSTMAVFGHGKSLDAWEITGDEPLAACDLYGQSKLEAERGLRAMEQPEFRVAIVRPPSVYGKGCRGSLMGIYTSLALALPLIPEAQPGIKQGMVHIDNLCACIREIVDTRRQGFFHPQDAEPLSTAEILFWIRKAHARRGVRSRAAGALLWPLKWTTPYKKLFGAVTYSAPLVERNGFACTMATTRDGILKSF